MAETERKRSLHEGRLFAALAVIVGLVAASVGFGAVFSTVLGAVALGLGISIISV